MILKIQGISKNFGGLTALKDVDFQIMEGEIFSIIGPNGAGKTTLFNIISGLLPPTEGNIAFKGTCITNLKSYQVARLGFGRTFQNIRLFGQMTVLENIQVAQHKVTRSFIVSVLTSRERITEKIDSILRLFNLFEKRNIKVQDLPYGEQRYVEMAQCLATDCDLLLLDEPSAGLNTYETENLMATLRRIRETGKTIVIIEHDMQLVMGLSDRIGVLNFGVKIAEGLPEEIQKNSLVIEAYLGKEKEKVA